MNIKYATGDVEFDKDGKSYLWLMYLGDTIAEVVSARSAAHSSHTSTVFEIDIDDVKRLAITSGMTRGNRDMCRIIRRVGLYFEENLK